MMRNVLRHLTIVVMCLAGMGTIFWASASQDQAQGIPSLPEDLGQWAGVDQAVEDRTRELLGTDQVLMREYRNSQREPVWLAVVYAAENRSAFHPPELCYTGSNYEIVGRSTVALAGVDATRRMDANRLLMTNGQHQLLAYYWLTAGDETFTSWHKQQLRLLWNQIRRRPSNGMLIRMSTVVRPGDTDQRAAEQRLQDMAALVMTEVSADYRGHLDSARDNRI